MIHTETRGSWDGIWFTSIWTLQTVSAPSNPMILCGWVGFFFGFFLAHETDLNILIVQF